MNEKNDEVEAISSDPQSRCRTIRMAIPTPAPTPPSGGDDEEGKGGKREWE